MSALRLSPRRLGVGLHVSVVVALVGSPGCSPASVGSDSLPTGGSGAAGSVAPPQIAVLDAHPVLSDTHARVWVELSHAYDETITVWLDTQDASAIGDPSGGGDYVPVSVEVTIPAGSLRPPAAVLIEVDVPYETLTLETALAKHFETRLSSPSAGTLGDPEGVVTLGAAGMVIETPLAVQLGEVDVLDDFNGDGLPDLLLSGSAGHGALLLTPGTTFAEGEHVVADETWLDGVRGFSWHVSHPIGGEYVFGDHTQGMDANGDGLTDAFVIGEGSAHILYGSDAPVPIFDPGDPRLEDGTTATRLADFYFGYGAGPIQTGDWNDDGIVDFAQASFYSSAGGGDDAVDGFWGESGALGGVFTATQTFSFPSGTTPVGHASLLSGTSNVGRVDLDGDGRDDFVYVGLAANDGQFGGNHLYVRMGDGSTFTGSSPVTGTLDGSNGFQVSNDASTYYASGTFTPQDAGDLNGDGIEDLVLTAGGAPLTVIFGRASNYASGTYATLQDMGAEAAFFNTEPVSGARIGDLNADGIGDIVFVTENKLRVIWGRPDLTGKDIFGTQYPEVGEIDIDPMSGLDHVGLVADLDGDQADDIVVLSDTWKSGTGGALIVFGKTITPTLGGPEIEPPK